MTLTSGAADSQGALPHSVDRRDTVMGLAIEGEAIIDFVGDNEQIVLDR